MPAKKSKTKGRAAMGRPKGRKPTKARKAKAA